MAVTADPMPRAIRFGDLADSFALTATGVVVTGEPTYGDLEAALEFADEMEKRSPFWKGDLLNYAYSRVDWQGSIDAIVDRWALTPETLDNYRSVAKRVPAERRVRELSYGHHEAIASKPEAEQAEYLARAQKEHLTVSKLKQVVSKEKRVRKILSGQASALAKAQNAVIEHAHEAAAHCRAIAHHDCHEGEKMIAKARRELDRAEEALLRFRKAQGK